jgi:hypothetical protein
MAIVRLRPDGTIRVLSLPRDLVVPATDTTGPTTTGGPPAVTPEGATVGIRPC